MKRKLRYSVEKYTLNPYNCQQIVNFENVKAERNFSQYISCLATYRKVTPSTQNQAMNALVFLCKKV